MRAAGNSWRLASRCQNCRRACGYLWLCQFDNRVAEALNQSDTLELCGNCLSVSMRGLLFRFGCLKLCDNESREVAQQVNSYNSLFAMSAGRYASA